MYIDVIDVIIQFITGIVGIVGVFILGGLLLIEKEEKEQFKNQK